MEAEIPLRHWHLNDPGVVPNLLQTGQGSPTGICVYEGRLLPKAFWDQVIHCDAGPNIVRAYPAKKDGTGYVTAIPPLADSDYIAADIRRLLAVTVNGLSGAVTVNAPGADDAAVDGVTPLSEAATTAGTDSTASRRRITESPLPPAPATGR